MRLTWGLNPLASEFEPQSLNPYRNSSLSTYSSQVKPEASTSPRINSAYEEASAPTQSSSASASTTALVRSHPPQIPSNFNQYRPQQFYPVPLGYRGMIPADTSNPYFYGAPLQPMVWQLHWTLRKSTRIVVLNH